MSLGVFLSWSGERSMNFARELEWWLPRVVRGVRPWMSDSDIAKGERWGDRIGETLDTHRVGIVCVTPENTTAPWLLFEAGALSRLLTESRVCPVLLGMRAEDVTGPLSQFQATVFDRKEMLALVKSINASLGDEADDDSVIIDTFDKFWPELEKRMDRIAEIKMDPDSVPLVIRTFAKYGLPEPSIGSIAHFSGGFESHSIYSTVSEIATKRLFVWGRKNRKLFDKERLAFFASLKARVHDGFDFKCLFLDSEAPEHVITAAHENKTFPNELTECTIRALCVLSDHGLDPSRHLRTYRVARTSAAIVVDDAVLYTPVHMGTEGRALALTKCGFSVVNSSSPLGSQLTNEFLSLWNAGGKLS